MSDSTAGPGPTVVFVAGVGRSGSTMLSLMLGNHRRSASCGEIVNWYRPVVARHRRSIRCGCSRADCPEWSGLSHRHPEHFHREFADRRGVDVVVDSSKRVTWLIDASRWCRDAGFTVRTVVIWKTPERLAYSRWRRSGDIWLWRDRFVDYHRSLLDAGVPFVALSYEELISDVPRVMAELSRTLGVPWAEAQERFWEHPHHHAYGSQGMRSQLDAGTSTFALTDLPEDFSFAWAAVEESAANDAAVASVQAALRAHQLGHHIPNWATLPEAKRDHQLQRVKERLRGTAVGLRVAVDR